MNTDFMVTKANREMLGFATIRFRDDAKPGTGFSQREAAGLVEKARGWESALICDGYIGRLGDTEMFVHIHDNGSDLPAYFVTVLTNDRKLIDHVPVPKYGPSGQRVARVLERIYSDSRCDENSRTPAEIRHRMADAARALLRKRSSS